MGVFIRQAFKHLDAFERNFIQQQVSIGRSLRSIAKEMDRPASTISREVARNPGDARGYEAIGAVSAARGRRRRRLVKLREGSVLREHVITHIRKGWSPQQISGALARMSEPVGTVSHETIYQMIYVLPRGVIRREIIGFLRQGKKLRCPCGQAKDRRGGLVGMTSIHERPASVLTREVFGDVEGDLI